MSFSQVLLVSAADVAKVCQRLEIHSRNQTTIAHEEGLMGLYKEPAVPGFFATLFSTYVICEQLLAPGQTEPKHRLPASYISKSTQNNLDTYINTACRDVHGMIRMDTEKFK